MSSKKMYCTFHCAHTEEYCRRKNPCHMPSYVSSYLYKNSWITKRKNYRYYIKIKRLRLAPRLKRKKSPCAFLRRKARHAPSIPPKNKIIAISTPVLCNKKLSTTGNVWIVFFTNKQTTPAMIKSAQYKNKLIHVVTVTW